jgi:hypothetical protein
LQANAVVRLGRRRACREADQQQHAAEQLTEHVHGWSFFTPLETMNTRPEWKPCTLLQPEVISKSSLPSPSTSPRPTASKPKVSPGVLQV